MMTLSCIHAAAAATVFWASPTFSLPSKDPFFCLVSTALAGMNLPPHLITCKWNDIHHSHSNSSIPLSSINYASHFWNISFEKKKKKIYFLKKKKL